MTEEWVVNALSDLRVESVAANRVSIAEAGIQRLPPQTEARALYVSHGSAALSFEDQRQEISLRVNDFLLAAPERAMALLADAPVSVVCVRFQLRGPWSLPTSLYVPAQRSHGLRAAMELLADESSGVIAARLADAVLLYALREHDERRLDEDDSWWAALSDPRIGSSLRSMHEAIAKPWTVAELAAEAGMSRSVYAQKFKELVGEGPLEHLTRWRIHKASQLLLEGDRTLADVAQSIGYASDAAFHRAFRRSTGVSPGEYRRLHN